MLGLAGVRGGLLAATFGRETRAYAELDRRLAALPPDALVLCVRHRRSAAWDFGRWHPVMVYGGHLAVLGGHFVSGTFDLPTQQPIVIRPEWASVDRSYEEDSADGSLATALPKIRADLAATTAPHGPVVLYYMPPEDAPRPPLAGLSVLAEGGDYLLARLP